MYANAIFYLRFGGDVANSCRCKNTERTKDILKVWAAIKYPNVIENRILLMTTLVIFVHLYLLF